MAELVKPRNSRQCNVPRTANCQDDIYVPVSAQMLSQPDLNEKGLMTNLTFLGHSNSAQGVNPDFNKVAAIVNMPIPINVKELQRFLGMISSQQIHP